MAELVDHDVERLGGVAERRSVQERQPSVMWQVAALTHSGPAKPRTPESGPKSRSKISPVSSKTMAERPSGAGGQVGPKFVMSTSTGSGPALT